MSKPQSLKPQDIVVALRLAEMPGAPFASLGADLSMSQSTAHESVDRLQRAGLLHPETRQPNRHSLMEFLVHGVRYAFPAELAGRVRGVPTAHSSPVIASAIVSYDTIVWPDVGGSAVGHGLTPLLPSAVRLPSKCPPVYELLTLVDAVRVGRVRERAKAVDVLGRRVRRVG